MKTRFIQYYWILGLMCFGFSPKTNAQTVDRFEYWFNDNFSSRTPPIPIATSSSETLLDSEVDISSLPEGLHTIHVRFGTANDTFWSSVSSFLFYRTIASNNEPISMAQYWFNDDFSHANQIAVSATIQNEGFILDSSIGVDTLREGLHRFNIRFGGTAGWSSVSTHLFYKTNSASTEAISLYQYWFDDNFNPSDTYPISTTIQNDGFLLDKQLDISTLNEGLHRFNIRFGGTAGWSSVSTHLFYKPNDSIQGFEYWFGDDFARRTYRTVTPDRNSVFLDELDTGISCDTLMKINVRFQLPASGWSSVATDTLFIRGSNNVNPFIETITHTTCSLNNGQIQIQSPLNNALYALNNGSFQSDTVFKTLHAGTYTIKRRDIAGCQLSKTLIINASAPARIVDTTVTVCHQFQLGDTVLTSSGTYRRTLRSTMHCDSFVTVRLTVPQVRRDTFPTLTICENGIARDSVFADTVRSRQGCDSIIKVIRWQIVPILAPTVSVLPTCNSRHSGLATIQFNRSRQQIGIRWSNNDTSLIINGLAKGNYVVTITDSICRNQLVQRFEILQTHTVNAFVNTTRACKDRDNGTAIVITTSGNRPFRYSWSDSSRIDSSATRLKSGNYKVTVADAQRCDTAQVPFRITETLSNIADTVKIDTVLCETNVLRLYGKDYTPGFYEFRLNNPTGCDTIVQIKLAKTTTNPKHFLNIMPRNTTIQMGDSIRLKLNPNFKPITIHWKPNSCVNCVAMEVKPFSDQTYFVEAQDSQKCVMRDSVWVKVKRGYYDIPNAYYPDKGANYTVYPDKAIQRIERLRIYDRQGTLIYDSALEGAFVVGKTGWNGKFRDEPVPSGVYVVIVETLLKSDIHETTTSDLTIIR